MGSGVEVLMEETVHGKGLIIPAVQGWTMDGQEETGSCLESPPTDEGPASSCPVFPVENGAILVGLGPFFVLLRVVPVFVLNATVYRGIGIIPPIGFCWEPVPVETGAPSWCSFHWLCNAAMSMVVPDPV
jgi:hypothetical protein